MKVYVRRGYEKEKQRAKLTVFTAYWVVRQRVGDRGPRMARRGRETKERQTRKATYVAA